MNDITKSRKQRLRACETVLTEHGKQWVAVGKALMEIRDNDFYRESGYKSWSKYLSENEAKFGIGSESQANTYIRAASVMPSLPKPTAPSGGFGWSIKHASELDRLPTNAAAAKVAKTVMDNGKPPTVAVVKRAVDKALGIKPKKKQKPKPAVAPDFTDPTPQGYRLIWGLGGLAGPCRRVALPAQGGPPERSVVTGSPTPHPSGSLTSAWQSSVPHTHAQYVTCAAYSKKSGARL